MRLDAELMLAQWGAWNRGNQPLDLPSLSIIGRCMLEGAGASHSTVAGEPHMAKAVEITEHCVLGMPKHLQRVCKHRYIGDEPDALAAKKLRITVNEYQSRINQAVHILVNYLIEY